MTEEEAYERLELQHGANLQDVRRKFAELHNDCRMRIDNAPTPRLKQTFERNLEGIKEAYALLNESEGIDDTMDLPRIAQTGKFEPLDEMQKNRVNQPPDLTGALALFELSTLHSSETIEETVRAHIALLKQQRDTISLPDAKQVYQREIDRADQANTVITTWLSERQTTKISIDMPLPAEEITVSRPSKRHVWRILLVVVGLVVVAGAFYIIVFESKGEAGKIPTIDGSNSQDSAAWQAALAANNQSAYEYYLNIHPNGLFSKAANDSLKHVKNQTIKKENATAIEQQKHDVPAKVPSKKPTIDINQYNKDLTWAKNMISVDGCEGCKYVPLCKEQVVNRLKKALAANPNGHEAKEILDCLN